jgi:hypothetical protein
MFLNEASCGNCVEAHGGLGCEQSECEATICGIDPFCCDVAWDGICASEALDICVPDICIALQANNVPAAYLGRLEGIRAEVEPLSKDPDYVPKEE